MSTSELATELFAQVFKRAGFRRRRNSWYHNGEEVFVNVSKQNSNWDDLFYINIGLMPIGEVVNGYASEVKCWVRFRIEAIEDMPRDALNLLYNGPMEGQVIGEWERQVESRVLNPLIEVLDSIVYLTDLKRVVQGRLSGSVMLDRRIRLLIDLPASG